MSSEELHQKISDVLELIEINNNRLALNTSTYEMDLDQLRAHILELYTCLDKLQLAIVKDRSKPSATAGAPETVQIPKEVPKEVKPIEPPVKSEPVAEKIEELPAQPEPIVEAPKVESKPVFTPEVYVPDPESVHQVVDEEEIPEPVITAVKVPTQNPETLAKKKSTQDAEANGDIYSKLKYSKLESIKKGINISKRYEIQNELFGNAPENYNEAIKKLDGQSSLAEAFAVLDVELGAALGWDPEDALVEELRTLLIRRYI